MNKLPPFIDKILNDYVSQLNSIRPDLIEGIYLTGSVPLNDYYPKKSDIDFITVLKDSPGKEILKGIQHIHRNIEITHNYPKLNGYYLTIEGITGNQKSFPSFFKNRMYFDRPFELDKLTLWELKTSSYKVYGIPAADLPVTVELKEVITQLHQNINSYWASWIWKHSSFHLHHVLLILFPRLTEWGILGVARQLYTIETGKIASKLKAGTYCLNNLPGDLRNIMLTALETRRINRTQLKPSLKRAKETLNCMKFIIAQFNKIYRSE
ncbi:MAG: DUF4111 domain-containing protein [Flavisolibacter sp.]|nr:DUF4111 domain-containing protein [Flavisolibacter sp.]